MSVLRCPGAQMDAWLGPWSGTELRKVWVGVRADGRTPDTWEQNSQSSQYPTVSQGSGVPLWKTGAQGLNPASTTH